MILSNDNDNDVEICGYLQKKTSKGYYVSRYFATTGHFLKYWQDKEQHEKNENASEVFNICEIKNIEKASGKQIYLYFVNERFKLELKAGSDEQCSEWVNVLQAKKSLYSIDELMSDITRDVISLRTKTFQTLLVLKEKDQNKWILDRLDDIFESNSDESRTQEMRQDPYCLIKAARAVVDELLASCDDCVTEMSSRNPKIIVHCRAYIRRYAEIVKGRISLELLFLPGIQEKKYDVIGEKSICAAIELMSQIDRLGTYNFIPHDLVPTLNNTLFTTGQLISSFLNLSISRVDAFMDSILQLDISLRSERYLEFQNVLNEFLHFVDIDLPSSEWLHIVLVKVVTAQVLTFADQLSLLPLTGYDEPSLIAHILACNGLIDKFRYYAINAKSRQLMNIGDDKLRNGSMSDSMEDGENSSKYNNNAQFLVNPKDIIPFPAAVYDALKSSCQTSIRTALLNAVYNMKHALTDITEGFLHERNVGWVGGDLCKAYIDRFDQWTLHFTEELPVKYAKFIFIEVSQLMIVLYVQNMIHCYQSNKSIKLSQKSIKQIIDDLKVINVWIDNHVPNDHTTSQYNVNSGVKNGILQDLNNVINNIILFLSCNQDSVLPNYAQAIQQLGIQYALHFYDLIRLLLKYRIDFSAKTRKSILGLCGEFLQQLQKTVNVDAQLFSGLNSNKHGNEKFVLDLLFPNIGVEHCTGKKWSIEQLADPLPVRLTISLLVTTTCNEARAIRKRQSILELESSKSNASKSPSLLSDISSTSPRPIDFTKDFTGSNNNNNHYSNKPDISPITSPGFGGNQYLFLSDKTTKSTNPFDNASSYMETPTPITDYSNSNSNYASRSSTLKSTTSIYQNRPLPDVPTPKNVTFTNEFDEQAMIMMGTTKNANNNNNINIKTPSPITLVAPTQESKPMTNEEKRRSMLANRPLPVPPPAAATVSATVVATSSNNHNTIKTSASPNENISANVEPSSSSNISSKPVINTTSNSKPPPPPPRPKTNNPFASNNAANSTNVGIARESIRFDATSINNNSNSNSNNSSRSSSQRFSRNISFKEVLMSTDSVQLDMAMRLEEDKKKRDSTKTTTKLNATNSSPDNQTIAENNSDKILNNVNNGGNNNSNRKSMRPFSIRGMLSSSNNNKPPPPPPKPAKRTSTLSPVTDDASGSRSGDTSATDSPAKVVDKSAVGNNNNNNSKMSIAERNDNSEQQQQQQQQDEDQIALKILLSQAQTNAVKMIQQKNTSGKN